MASSVACFWQRWGGTLVALLLGLMLAIGIVLVVHTLHHNTDATGAACVAANQVRSALIVILNRSYQTIPAIAYYHTHPVDMAHALQQTTAAIQTLRPIHC